MTDEDALKATIREHPHEDTPRLMYADWLEEHGERPEQAQFIRERRVGEHMGKLRQSAVNASRNTRYLDPRTATDTYRLAQQARQKADTGEHLAAATLHDRTANLYTDNTVGLASHARVRRRQLGEAALGHFLAAHHNENVYRHLGSEADKASDTAIEATSKSIYHPGPQLDEDRELNEVAAKEHNRAGDLHWAEGNEATAMRHYSLADLHRQRMEDYWTA